MVDRLVREHASGETTFEAPGEALFAARVGQTPVGVCGLTVDPYTREPRTGRVRRLYVAPPYRRRGLGSALVRRVIARATGHFLRLRAYDPDADVAAFFESVGFEPVRGEQRCSHMLLLPSEAPQDGGLLIVREARIADLAALTEMRYGETLHRDRIRDADGETLRYLLAEVDRKLAGFACLVTDQPKNWPAIEHLPQVIDLFIRPDDRGRGIGGALLDVLERMAWRAGFIDMNLAAEPESEAADLYARMGYEPIDPDPKHETWSFTDSRGVVHAAEGMVLHLRKTLRDPNH